MNSERDIILVDKPAGWTSFDVVAKIRGKIRADYVEKREKPTKRQLKVGHAGTLDPFATGLLIILLGDACKKAGDFLKLDKTYEFTAKLGEVSTTGDPEGEILEYKASKIENTEAVISVQAGIQSDSTTNASQNTIPTLEDVMQALKQFTGDIMQTPPVFSAIKVHGQRAYKLAREGKHVTIPERKATISRLELISYEYPFLKCVCDVSSGTYIRTLVEDIGKKLNTGAYCTKLRRTRTGKYKIESAELVENSIVKL